MKLQRLLLLSLLCYFTMWNVSANCSGALSVFLKSNPIHSNILKFMEHATAEVYQMRSIDTLLEKQAFVDFLKSKPSIKWNELNQSEKNSLGAIFFQEELAKYKNINLREKREKTMLEILRMHGLKSFSSNGYLELKNLSQKNKDRLLGELVEDRSDLSDVVTNFVRDLNLLPVHHTHVVSTVNEFPILSSREITGITGLGGLNVHTFNRQFLKSDNAVFFFPKFEVKGVHNSFQERYGRFKLSLEKDFMYEYGIVSPFVMKEGELNTFGKYFKDEETMSAVIKTLNGRRTALYYPDETETLSSWAHLRDKLHLFDFTPSDYMELTKIVFLDWASKLKRTSPNEYDQLISDIENKHRLLFKNIEKAYAEQLGVEFKFEFKIPTAVESENLILLD